MLEGNVILLLGWCKERKLQRQAMIFFSELAAMSVNTIFHVLIQKAQAFEKGER